MPQTPIRLGKRLRAIVELIDPETNRCYDLCCDHGLIGRRFGEQQPLCQVFFNDSRAAILARLTEIFGDSERQRYRILTGCAEKISLHPTLRGTVVVAGVGDIITIRILSALFQQTSAKNYDFIIAPANRCAQVRQFLAASATNLVSESVVTERQRSYELIKVRLADRPHKTLSLTGECWQADNPDHRRHLQKLIDYYRRQLQQKSNPELEALIVAYEQKINN